MRLISSNGITWIALGNKQMGIAWGDRRSTHVFCAAICSCGSVLKRPRYKPSRMAYNRASPILTSFCCSKISTISIFSLSTAIWIPERPSMFVQFTLTGFGSCRHLITVCLSPLSMASRKTLQQYGNYLLWK